MIRVFQAVAAGLLAIVAAVPAAADETADRAAEAARDRTVRAEANRVAGLHVLAQGRRLRDAGRLEEAAEALARAVDLLPASPEAREALQAVKSALGATPDRRREILQALAQAQAAREDQQHLEVQGRIREGERLLQEGRFAEALRRLREAEEILRWMPPGQREGGRWGRLAAELAASAERQAAEEARRRLEAQRLEAAAAVAREAEEAGRRRRDRAAALEARGIEALRARRFDEAERLAAEVEALQPGSPAAGRMRLWARERRHGEARAALALARTEETANLREAADEQQVPYSRQPLRHPDGWEAVRRRGQALSGARNEVEPAWKRQLGERLLQTVHYRFDGIPFKDAREYLETQGRVAINVDRLAQDANPQLDETLVRLSSPGDGMSLESALNLLMRQVGLRWTLRDEAVTVTTEAGLLEEPETLVQYDVRDLITSLKDYPGPALRLSGNGGGIEVDKEEEREGDITRDDLLEFIKSLVEGAAPRR